MNRSGFRRQGLRARRALTYRTPTDLFGQGLAISAGPDARRPCLLSHPIAPEAGQRERVPASASVKGAHGKGDTFRRQSAAGLWCRTNLAAHDDQRYHLWHVMAESHKKQSGIERPAACSPQRENSFDPHGLAKEERSLLRRGSGWLCSRARRVAAAPWRVNTKRSGKVPISINEQTAFVSLITL